MSCTVILNESVASLLLLSVAVQVTVVSPSGKVSPDWWSQTGVIEPSTASVAEAVNVTTAPAELVASVLCQPVP